MRLKGEKKQSEVVDDLTEPRRKDALNVAGERSDLSRFERNINNHILLFLIRFYICPCGLVRGYLGIIVEEHIWNLHFLSGNVDGSRHIANCQHAVLYRTWGNTGCSHCVHECVCACVCVCDFTRTQ